MEAKNGLKHTSIIANSYSDNAKEEKELDKDKTDSKLKKPSRLSRSFEVPKSIDCLQGILTVIPMQLLSMHIADLKKCDVSCPLAEGLPTNTIQIISLLHKCLIIAWLYL